MSVIIILVKLTSFSKNLHSFFLNDSYNVAFKAYCLETSGILLTILPYIFFLDSSNVLYDKKLPRKAL